MLILFDRCVPGIFLENDDLSLPVIDDFCLFYSLVVFRAYFIKKHVRAAMYSGLES
jgi:hypothetical protein